MAEWVIGIYFEYAPNTGLRGSTLSNQHMSMGFSHFKFPSLQLFGCEFDYHVPSSDSSVLFMLLGRA